MSSFYLMKYLMSDGFDYGHGDYDSWVLCYLWLLMMMNVVLLLLVLMLAHICHRLNFFGDHYLYCYYCFWLAEVENYPIWFIVIWSFLTLRLIELHIPFSFICIPSILIYENSSSIYTQYPWTYTIHPMSDILPPSWDNHSPLSYI